MSQTRAAEVRRPSSTLQTTGVLSALAGDGAGRSVREIAQTVGTSRSAAHRALQSLHDDGFAIQDEQGRYRAGPKLIQLAARIMAGSPVIECADRIMAALVTEVNETAYLAMLVPDELAATFVHRVECSRPIRYVKPVGTRIPLHAGAVGKAVLAALDAADPRSLTLHRYTKNTPTTPEKLARDIELIRRRGFATSVEERVEGAAGVAAAVVVGDHPIGALTVTVPTSRIPDLGLDTLGPTVARYATELSTLLEATKYAGL